MIYDSIEVRGFLTIPILAESAYNKLNLERTWSCCDLGVPLLFSQPGFSTSLIDKLCYRMGRASQSTQAAIQKIMKD